MDTPLDFRLDRNRILSNGIPSGSFGNYDSAFAENSRVSALNRSVSGSIPDLARIGTPASLSQFPSRYFPHTVGAHGSSFLGSYLPSTAVPVPEHLKSLLPEEYWAAHGIDGTRYVLNNNLYSPYFPYLPATESLSLFAHNLSSAGVDQSGYHRIYDLRKDAAVYSGLQMGSPPSNGAQNSPNDTHCKKESSRTESKRTESAKHGSKIHETVSKLHASQKLSKDSEKRQDLKKLEKTQTNSKSQIPVNKVTSTKKEKSIKTDVKAINKLDEKAKNSSADDKVLLSKEEKLDKFEKSDIHLKTDTKLNIDISADFECKNVKENDEEEENVDDSSKKSTQKQLSSPKETAIKCKRTNVVTMTTVTSSSSMVSILESPTGSGLIKPVVTTDPYKDTTATTFSLPYYHSLFSTSHSLPPSHTNSTVTTASMCSEPVQTAPFDMRIKKEPLTYVCSTTSTETKTTESNKNQVKDLKPEKNLGVKEEQKIDKFGDVKSPVFPPICSVTTPTSNVMPLCLKKHILEKSKDLNISETNSNVSSNQHIDSKKISLLSDSVSNDAKVSDRNNSNGSEDDKILAEFKHKHSKEVQQLTTTSKDTVKAISKVLSKRQESSETFKSSTDNSRTLASPRKQDPKLPTKRVLIKPKCDDKKITGSNKIPIGIAVARKREDLKKDDFDENVGDARDNQESSNATSNNNSSQERTNEQSSSSTKSITNVNVVDMRSQLPANLIVTGSASGAGIAWSDDPTARHFPTQWLQTPHQLNQSWIGQLPFQIPSAIPTSGTSDQTLPITIPPGYKIAQDSVTGQLVMIPSNDIEIYDPTRVWSSFTANPQAMITTHPSHQILPHTQDRTMPFVVQSYQHLLQNRQENVPQTESVQNQNLQAAAGSIKNKVSKDVSAPKAIKGSEKKVKSVGMVTPQVSTDMSTSVQTLPYSYSGPVPLIVNPSLTSNVPVSCAATIAIKPEISMVQSRGTSPMVPASEIEETAQEMIDNSPIPDKSDNERQVLRKPDINDDDESSFSSTDSFITGRPSVNIVDDSFSESTDKEVVKTSDEKKETPLIQDCDVKVQTDTTNSLITKREDIEPITNHDSDQKTDKMADSCLKNCDATTIDNKVTKQESDVKTDSCELKVDLEKNSTEEKAEKEQKSSEDYDPYLDPQILQAVDGLELLSALAEKRSKSIDQKAEKKEDQKEEIEEVKEKVEKKPVEKKKPVKRPKLKRTISRTRSIPPVKEPETPSYYTSTGLRIPQGEEEINAIELDMRIRLAELQRQYKEKQKQLSKLQPKKEKEKEKEVTKDIKDKEPGDSKRGPGRPKKNPVSSPGSDTSDKKMSPKSKDSSAKKKKPAEELVDRVFRKTGGGFGMPLSKKLKANAMAALFKTQSGFTVKRKGSTSDKSFSSSSKLVKVKKHLHKVSTDKKESNSELKKSSDENDEKISPKIKKSKEEHKDESLKTWHKESSKKSKDKDGSINSGLGLLAKYATNALKEHSTLKKIKRKRLEGSCSEEKSEHVNKGDENAINNETNENKDSSSNIPTPKVEEAEKRHADGSSEPKKRKPGRPRKGTPTRTTGVTETLVAKPSKNFQFFQYQSFQDLAQRSKDESEPTTKSEPESPMKPLFLDEEWLLRRSERIFLSDPSPQASPNYSNTPSKTSTTKPPSKSESKSKSDQAKLQKARNMKELTQKVKRKYKKSMEKRSSQKAKEKKELDQNRLELKKVRSKSVDTKPDTSLSYNNDDDSSESEADNIPLSFLKERPSTPASTRTCVLCEEDLKEGLNVLVFKDSLFYEGTVQPIHPPDIYGVLIKNERGNRPHIYSREEILKEVILDLQPESVQHIPEGSRVCAYWSQQFNCLYPGTVSRGSPNSNSDKRFINVEFDDGDSGRIPLDHIRQLPADFPLVSYDPNPLLLIGKRRRHTTSDISECRKSESSSSTSDSQPKVKRGPGRPPKIKKEESALSEMASEDEQDIDVCGFDDSDTDTDRDDTDSVFGSNYSQKHHKHSGAKRKHKSDNDKDEKVKKKKVIGDDKKRDRNVFEDQDFMPPPPRQFWRWHGKSTKRPGMKGKAKKEFYKEIIRGKEEIKVGDCAVFVSTGRPHLPYIGRIDSMWESWGGQMTVKVKWFYHPEETRGGKKLQDMKRALFQSPHFDENDVQTISHKCEVISYTDYRQGDFDKLESSDVYYLAGTYEPTIGLLKFEQDIM